MDKSGEEVISLVQALKESAVGVTDREILVCRSFTAFYPSPKPSKGAISRAAQRLAHETMREVLKGLYGQETAERPI